MRVFRWNLFVLVMYLCEYLQIYEIAHLVFIYLSHFLN